MTTRVTRTSREAPRPHNHEAERATIGALFINPEQCAEVLAFLDDDDMWEEKHRYVFGAIRRYVEASGEMPDQVLLGEALRRAEQFAAAQFGDGSTYYTNSVPTSARAMQYARIVKATAMQRKASDAAGGAFAALAASEPDTVAIQVMLERALDANAGIAPAAGSGASSLTNGARHNGVWRPQGHDLTELLTHPLEPVQWVIRDLIGEGLTLLASKSKKGKSTLMLGISIAIRQHARALAHFDVAADDCEVLYLALDGDGQRRMHRRLDKLLEGGAYTLPTGITVVYEWPPLDRGGLAALDAYLEASPRTGLVIVDTLEQVRPTRRAQQVGLYADDYAAATQLRALAGRRRRSIVALTHLRKAPAEDVFDEITGSTGLLAGVDNALVLKPNGGNGTTSGVMEVHRRGRDYEDDTPFAMEGNRQTLRWTWRGSVADATRRDARSDVLAAIRTHPGYTATELAALTPQHSASYVRAILSRLLIEEPSPITYDHARRYWPVVDSTPTHPP